MKKLNERKAMVLAKFATLNHTCGFFCEGQLEELDQYSDQEFINYLKHSELVVTIDVDDEDAELYARAVALIGSVDLLNISDREKGAMLVGRECSSIIRVLQGNFDLVHHLCVINVSRIKLC